MITEDQLKPVGVFLKPHGINGEIALQRDFDDIDFDEFRCIVVDVDGIFVPFFIDGVRPKGAETDLLSIDGIDNETQAARLTNKTVYLLRDELSAFRRKVAEESGDEEEEGFFADDLVGFAVRTDEGTELGQIVSIDDSTANYLFVVETESGRNLLIPVAEEFIAGIDTERNILTLSLPEGLLEL